MIFVATGSQKFQFNRLIRTIDRLVYLGKIKEPVFAQIGHSTYKPKYIKYTDYMSPESYEEKLEKCDILITHGGIGTILYGLKKNKTIIGIPRLQKYREHVDDHQIQILEKLKNDNYIETCYDLESLDKVIQHARNHRFEEYKSNRTNIFKKITDFIDEN